MFIITEYVLNASGEYKPDFLFLTLYTPWGYTFSMATQDKKAFLRRLRIIEGQVRGLSKMIDSGEYCVDIITQTSAIKNALGSLEDALLENHLGTCVINQIRSGKEKKAVEEILNVYRLKRK